MSAIIGNGRVHEVQGKHIRSIQRRMRIKETFLEEVTLKQSLEEPVRINLVRRVRKGYIINRKTM